jgi:RNA polymerase sigma-70 factor (ECF subfamily)
VNRDEREANLVLTAQQGDSAAFAALYDAHKAKVYSICLRMTANAAEAEDLTQDVFLHVFRKLSSFRRDSAFSTWLYRVTVNTVLMHFRKKKALTLSLDEPIDNAPGSRAREYGRTDLGLAGAVNRITVTRAMKELPVGYRTVFVLHEVKGYEHHDIARLLRCSIGTSKSQLHKAKARIRELLLPKKNWRPATPAIVSSPRPTERSWLVASRSIQKMSREHSEAA